MAVKKYILHSILFIISLSGCKVTKFVPEGQYLLNNVKIEVDENSLNSGGLKNQLRQKENSETLGFLKFHLHLYNLSLKNNEKGFFKRIGEAPVIYDEDLRNRSKLQMEQYLKNKGYYYSGVETETKYKGKKANVFYYINANQPYKINDIRYQIKDEHLRADIAACNESMLIKKGDFLDVDVLVKERSRLARALNEKGYYRFAEEYLYYKIDTIKSAMHANIEIIVERAQSPNTSVLNKPHKRYKVDSYEIFFEESTRDSLKSIIPYNDSLQTNGFIYRFSGKIPIVNSILERAIENKPGEYYSKLSDERSYSNLYGLRQFRFVNIQFQESEKKGDSINGYLNGKIFLPLQKKQNYSVDIEGTNTSGNYGVAGNLNYQHKNLFRGAQILELTIRGAMERQIAVINSITTEFPVRELGAEAKLLFPGFLLPFYESRFRFKVLPQTRFSVAYNYQQRPYYTRTLANATYGYQWRPSSFYTHFLNPVDLNIVRILHIDPKFESDIKDLYIKSSYTDHVISAASYSIVYNNQVSNKRGQYQFIRANFETAGNSLWVISKLLRVKEYEVEDPDPRFFSTYYKFLNVRFAQYIKSDIEFRKGIRIGDKHSLAFRTFAGVGLPYGNFNVIPFERRYFTGGSGGIRAWQVRTLGPGSYVGGASEYPNQSADIKLEANIEYRFKMVWMLEGALFLDGGNIWAINNKDNRVGAVFKFNSFYNEFALGTGFGLRLLAPFFIIRADLGLKLRDPALQGVRWIPVARSFRWSDLALNIAVGYPF
jgi:hypothetical protein